MSFLSRVHIVRSLGRFDVWWDPADRVRVVEDEQASGLVSDWSVLSLKPAAGYAGAVAAEGDQWAPVCRKWAHDPEIEE